MNFALLKLFHFLHHPLMFTQSSFSHHLQKSLPNVCFENNTRESMNTVDKIGNPRNPQIHWKNLPHFLKLTFGSKSEEKNSPTNKPPISAKISENGVVPKINTNITKNKCAINLLNGLFCMFHEEIISQNILPNIPSNAPSVPHEI